MKRVSTILYCVCAFFMLATLYTLGNDCTTTLIDEYLAALWSVTGVAAGLVAQAYRDRGE